MNSVNYNKDKFDVDGYGNLYPIAGLAVTYGHEAKQKEKTKTIFRRKDKKMSINMIENLPEPVQHLYFAALEIVGDYKSYGPVLQKDENDEYGPETAIGLLQAAVIEMEG